MLWFKIQYRQDQISEFDDKLTLVDAVDCKCTS